MQAQISIGHEFFKKERDNYGNFAFSFFRELHQNSIDAGASSIHIEIRKEKGLLPNGEQQKGIFVRFCDNGEGMDAETLTNVFFRLGATTKTTGKSIGGYGKARIAICFGQHSYGIKTQNCIVSGCGQEVNWDNNSVFHKGCEFWIDVDAMDRYGCEVDMVEQLRSFLSYSQIDCEITSNLPEINNFNDWLYKRRHVRTLSFGNVYVNKSGTRKGIMAIRVSGVPMFVKSHRADAQVVVEVDEEHSREILLSNRDSLNYKYESELDSFIQEIATETTSALKEWEPEEIVVGQKNATMITRRQKKVISSPVKSSPQCDPLAALGYKGEQPEAEKQDNIPDIFQDITNSSGATAATTVATRRETVSLEPSRNTMFSTSHEKRIATTLPTLALYCESKSAAMKKAMWLFNPENMDGKYFGATKKKLAIIWAVACESTIEAYLELKGQDELAWIPGFLFSDDNDGKHRKVNGAHQILLKPVNEKGGIKFHLNNKGDRTEILTLACHEIAHIGESCHDENYARLLTSLVSKVFVDVNAIFKQMSRMMRSDI